jgi:hypothetical protein
VLQMEHEKLASEYGAYRKRAVGLLKEKDDALRRMEDELTAARTKAKQRGAGGEADSGFVVPSAASPAHGRSGGVVQSTPGGPAAAAAARRQVSSGTGGFGGGSSGPPTPGGPPDAARWEYLRNVLVRYLSTPPDSDVRSHLEPALMMVLGLSPPEVMAIKSGRQAAAAAAAHGANGGVASGVDASPAAALLTGTLTSLWGTAASLLGMDGGAAAAGVHAAGPSPSASLPSGAPAMGGGFGFGGVPVPGASPAGTPAARLNFYAAQPGGGGGGR